MENESIRGHLIWLCVNCVGVGANLIAVFLNPANIPCIIAGLALAYFAHREYTDLMVKIGELRNAQ
jgi:hypothetical protein